MTAAIGSLDIDTHRATLKASPTPPETMNTTVDSVGTGTYHATLQTPPTMKSVRFHGPGDIRVEDIEEPLCGRGQVKVYLVPFWRREDD